MARGKVRVHQSQLVSFHNWPKSDQNSMASQSGPNWWTKISPIISNFPHSSFIPGINKRLSTFYSLSSSIHQMKFYILPLDKHEIPPTTILLRESKNRKSIFWGVRNVVVSKGPQYCLKSFLVFWGFNCKLRYKLICVCLNCNCSTQIIQHSHLLWVSSSADALFNGSLLSKWQQSKGQL